MSNPIAATSKYHAARVQAADASEKRAHIQKAETYQEQAARFVTRANIELFKGGAIKGRLVK